MKFVYKILASGFGSGFSPVAPGTAGSIAGCLILFLLALIFPQLSFSQWCALQLGLCAFLILAGIISVNMLEDEWGHDAPRYVIDEIAGMMIAVLFIPFSWNVLLIGFILFRFFDILKPFGIRSLEKVSGGAGVMLDDVLAGIYANILLRVLLFSGEYFNR